MKQKSLLTTLFLILGLGTYTVLNTSSSSGFGSYQSNCSCHGGASGNTTVAINAPTFYSPNTAYPVSVTVTNTSLSQAGFQIQTNLGTLTTADPGISIQGGNMSAGHNTRKAMVGNTATFNLTWTAPATGGMAATFNAVGNAVNGSGTGGDQWNSAPSTSIALPVNFSALEATATSSSIRVSFQTTSEKNIKQFEVERSVNATSFETIATLNVQNNTSYAFDDKTALKNILYYYRIKEVSNDNETTFSAVVSSKINSTISNELLIYPTVISNQEITIQGLQLALDNRAELFDMAGKKIKSYPINDKKLNLSNLTPGFYILNVRTNGQSVKTQRILIQ